MLILVDESFLSKDYYMESPAFSAVRKYGTVILCQCVLDRLFPVFLKEHDKRQLEEYKNFMSSFGQGTYIEHKFRKLQVILEVINDDVLHSRN